MKTEQRIEKLLTEVESLKGSEVRTQEMFNTFMRNNTEMKFLHMKELYRLGNSPADCKQIVSEVLGDDELAPLQKVCTEDACDVFDMWLAQ